ncbi:MAG TPA: hypothetical protein VN522_04090 [Solirubrobacterales bacterium]|nr:hypothetical protein [Solirubrobacterales bacterium]
MKRRLAAVVLMVLGGACATLVALTGISAAAPPVAVIEAATNPTYTTVEVAGKVNPEGGFTEWVFEVSSDGGASWTPAGGQNVSGFFFEGTTLEPVSGTIEGLRAGLTYKVRLTANNFADPAISSSELEFTTELVPAPTVTIDPVGVHTGTSAQLSGSITANSPAGDPAAADVHWHFACSVQCKISKQGTVAAGQSETVQAEVTGLEPNTGYTITLTGENAGGPVSAGPVAFTTSIVAPAAETLPANALGGGTGAKLRGNIDPNNSPAEYWFEYGPTTSYGQIAPAGGRADAGAGRGHVVAQEVDGLTPGTTYHYRLVAEGPGGPGAGGDVSFATAPTADQGCPNEAIRRAQFTTRLAECRAYELVTPPAKEGGRVGSPGSRLTNQPNGIRISSNGEAALYTTSTALPTSTSSTFLYKATRSSDGWTSTEVGLPAPAGVGGFTGVLTNVSADLSTGLFDEARSGAAEELFTGSDNLILHGLASGGFKSLLNPGQLPGFEGAVARGQSTDLSHAIFTSNTALTPDAPGGALSNLYDYAGGALHLVSILPDGQPDPVGGALGTDVPRYGESYDRFNAVSDDGSRIVFTALSDKQVYQRINDADTVEISASQGGADPTGAFPAQFVAATRTGSKVYFTSTAELTPDANTGGHTGKDLYEYDIGTGQLADLTADQNPGDPAGAGVLGLAGLSDDGSALYVVAEGVLAPGGTHGGPNLYLIRPGGATEFVATLSPGSGGTFDSPIWEGGFGVASGAAATPSGRYLAFATEGRLTPDAVPGFNVYLYDANAIGGPKLACASCGPGDAKDGNALLVGNEAWNLKTHQPRYVFNDGALFFSTSAALVEEDTNGRTDVYKYRNGAVNLISSGRGNANAEFVEASPDGRDVLIVTANRLLAADHDEAEDLYDVRVGGGFIEQPPASPCSGEGCRSPAAAPPATITPASAAQGGTSARSSFSVAKISLKALADFARTGKLTVHVKTADEGTVTATATAYLGSGKVNVAQARKTVPNASSASLVLRLSTAARRRLAQRGRLKVILTVGFSKAPRSSTRSLTLIAPKHDRKGR